MQGGPPHGGTSCATNATRRLRAGRDIASAGFGRPSSDAGWVCRRRCRPRDEGGVGKDEAGVLEQRLAGGNTDPAQDDQAHGTLTTNRSSERSGERSEGLANSGADSADPAVRVGTGSRGFAGLSPSGAVIRTTKGVDGPARHRPGVRSRVSPLTTRAAQRAIDNADNRLIVPSVVG